MSLEICQKGANNKKKVFGEWHLCGKNLCHNEMVREKVKLLGAKRKAVVGEIMTVYYCTEKKENLRVVKP